MVNLYRFCIAILFIAISFATAQEKSCSIESCNERFGSCVKDGDSIYSIVKTKTKEIDVAAMTLACQERLEKLGASFGRFEPPLSKLKPSDDAVSCINTKNTHHSHLGRQSLIYKQKETKSLYCSISVDPKPDLTDWNNCKSGKDHGFSWVIIGDAQGEGESRYKQEFWACDDPDIWITYNHPPESGGTADPNTPSNPNDDSKNGEDGDSGSGKGDNTGSENGSDNGNAPTGNGNGNGKGLSQSEVQQAIENALDSKGKSLEGKINQWWLSTQGEMEKEGLRLGHEANSLLDSGLAGLVNEKDINQLDRTYRFQLGVAKTCPEPYVLNLGKYQIPIPFDIFCQFAEIMGYLVIASAYMSAIYIVMGLRK
ncbi:virulence factor TspB C-terminal domain-related protein [Wohlfahrtiimonas chitiniclastica]|uniref:virulence factor TspB C-terminal domain-related protein n=1 Tax=Wohlfahrtiimonas chitiniclastica TaxID=400946 RepID=UPI00035D5782|nr:virulence factor TspB C-terminal domain-related protein [Wohlfahrtiimonas chitiniclastica]